MRENLYASYKIPLEYVRVGEDGNCKLADDFPKESAIEYIKQFSKMYFGLVPDIRFEDLKLMETIDKNKLKLYHEWVDEVDYTKFRILEEVVNRLGLRSTPTPDMLRVTDNRYKFSLDDYTNIVNIYNLMYKKQKLSKLDILKSMMRTVKGHVEMLFEKT